jgi:hypothetical protein
MQSRSRLVPGCLAVAVASVVSAPVKAQTAPSVPAILSALDMGIVNQNPLIYGRDGTYSAEIGGKSVWTFNDTAMRASNAEGKNFISNTLAWTDNLNASHGIYLNHDYLDKTGVPTEYMPFTAEEAAFNASHDSNACTAIPASTCGEDYAIWPSQIVPIPGTNAFYQYYALILRGGDISGFQVLGVGVAIGLDGKIIRPTATPGTTYPTLMWQGGETGYGGGYVMEGEYLYNYGCYGVFVTSVCNVSRVPILLALNKKAYQYYDASGGWSSDETAAAPVFDGGAAGNSVFYDKALRKYLAIYSGNFSNQVYYRAADHPWGPWSNQSLLFNAIPGESGSVDYAALAHPEFSEQDGLVQYVTYVQTTGFLQQDEQLVKVTFQK